MELSNRCTETNMWTINLLKYTTLKSDHKKGISKMPTEPPTYMDLDDIIK